MNKKGFTVVELIVSITLTFVIVSLLFQVLLSLRDVYVSSGVRTQLLNKQTIISSKLNEDLYNKDLVTVLKCGRNCLNFVYMDGTSSRLVIDVSNNIFRYGNYSTELVSGSRFRDVDIRVEKTADIPDSKKDSVLIMQIPIMHNLFEESYGVNVLFPFNSRETAIEDVVFDGYNDQESALILKGSSNMQVYNYIEPGWYTIEGDNDLIENDPRVEVVGEVDNSVYDTYELTYIFRIDGNIVDVKNRTVEIIMDCHPNCPLIGPYPDDKIEELILSGYVPIATRAELEQIDDNSSNIFGAGTIYEGTYEGGFDKNYLQLRDINVGEWEPVGYFNSWSDYEGLSGIYDGGNHRLANVEMHRPGESRVSFFSVLEEGSEIRNINFEDFYIEGESHVALISSMSYGSKIDNIKLSGGLMGDQYVYGLIGYMNYGSITNIDIDITIQGDSNLSGLLGSTYFLEGFDQKISNVKGEVNIAGRRTVSGLANSIGRMKINNIDLVIDLHNDPFSTSDTETGNFGGIAYDMSYGNSGENILSNINLSGTIRVNGPNASLVGGVLTGGQFSRIENVTTNVDITSSANYVGGLLAWESTRSIENVVINGNIIGDNYVGGLIGYVNDGSSTVNNVYVNSNIIGNNYVGGIAGYSRSGGIADPDPVIIFENIMFIGEIEGNDYIGGMIGYNNKIFIRNSLAFANISHSNDYGAISGWANTENSYYGVENTYYNSDLFPTSPDGTPKTESELRTGVPGPSIYTGWDESVWDFGNSTQLPRLIR